MAAFKYELYNFDMPKGTYNSAHIADLKQIGLHRDEGLVFILDSNSPKMSRIHKKNSLGYSGYWG